MADDTKLATFRGRGDQVGGNTVASFLGANILEATVEVAEDANAASVYTLFSLPSNARISGLSSLQWDDLDSAGAPTLDVGVVGDTDAINDGLDVTSAGSAGLIKDFADWGKYLWQLADLSADPGGELTLAMATADAACDTGGTISVRVVYQVEG